MTKEGEPVKNRDAEIFMWISIICYVITAFTPVVSYGFIAYFDTTIYGLFTSLEIVLFFGSILFAVLALINVSKPIVFRLCAYLTAALSIWPIIVLFAAFYVFGGLNIGFITYILAAVSSIVAGIVYKSNKKPPLQTILDTQKNQTSIPSSDKVVFLEYPEENVQKLSFQEQKDDTNLQSETDTWFCGNCGQKVKRTTSICEHCGFDLSEQ
ncbi:MAG: zinc ribbon domain-containing protein [Candidatus Heimdallarchaeota archaeon]|nr:zinc ribbon domain-containing protein [Candidatus Heimdallarchaeota archaeon]MCK4609618.1 zinc ribbon domain-containing protein [Candidatus Heimdallarchaeota archaeon]